MIKNKRASTFEGWITLVLLAAAGLALFAIMITSMNNQYNKTADLGPAYNSIQTQANASYGDILALQQKIQAGVNNGSASYGLTMVGLTLSTSYDMLLATINTMWVVINGAWITASVEMMQLPSIIGTILRLIYFLTIGFILLKVLFNRWGKI